jgi:hypothetical protein
MPCPSKSTFALPERHAKNGPQYSIPDYDSLAVLIADKDAEMVVAAR